MFKQSHPRARAIGAGFVVACVWAVLFLMLATPLALLVSVAVTGAVLYWLRRADLARQRARTEDLDAPLLLGETMSEQATE